MSLVELKNYLRIRGLKVNGGKNELVARVLQQKKMVLTRSLPKGFQKQDEFKYAFTHLSKHVFWCQ